MGAARKVKAVESQAEAQQDVAIEYAGFWVRFVAYLIDVLILSLLNFTIFWSTLNSLSAVGYSIIGLITEGIYLTAFWVWRGQTPGKIVVGVKVIRSDGASITLEKALLRCTVYLIYWLPVPLALRIPLPLLLLWIAFDRRKQGIHDKIADTLVVRIRPRRDRLPKTMAN